MRLLSCTERRDPSHPCPSLAGPASLFRSCASIGRRVCDGGVRAQTTGATPLIIAADNAHVGIIETLLAAGAPLDDADVRSAWDHVVFAYGVARYSSALCSSSTVGVVCAEDGWEGGWVGW